MSNGNRMVVRDPAEAVKFVPDRDQKSFEPPRHETRDFHLGKTRVKAFEDDSFSIVDMLLVTELKVQNGCDAGSKKKKREPEQRQNLGCISQNLLSGSRLPASDHAGLHGRYHEL
jgi:hypothetical protein